MSESEIGWGDKIFDANTKFTQLKQGTLIEHSHQVNCPKGKKLISWTLNDSEGGRCNQCEYFHGNSHNGIYCGWKKKIKREVKEKKETLIYHPSEEEEQESMKQVEAEEEAKAKYEDEERVREETEEQEKRETQEHPEEEE